MATQSIHSIDINDEKFKAFHALFQRYQAQLAKMPGQWGAVGVAASKANNLTAKGFEAVVNALAAQTAILQKSLEAQRKLSEEGNKSSRFWHGIAYDARSFASSIHSATLSLLKWGGISGAVSGLFGAGSIWGLERAAGSVADTSRTARGLGISYGQQQAFGLDVGRFVDPGQMLGAARNAVYDITNPAYVGMRNLGVTTGDVASGNAATISAKIIEGLPRLFAGVPKQLWGSRAQALGLDQFMDLGSIVRTLEATPEELRTQLARLKRDARDFELDKATQRKWQDLDTQLERANKSLSTYLIDKLTDLSGPLSNLSDSAVNVGKALIDGLAPAIGPAATNLNKFADYLRSADFKTELGKFKKDMGEAATSVAGFASNIGAAAKWLSGLVPKDTVKTTATGDSLPEATRDVGKIVGGVLGGAAGFMMGGPVTAAAGVYMGQYAGGRLGGALGNSLTGLPAAVSSVDTNLAAAGWMGGMPAYDGGGTAGVPAPAGAAETTLTPPWVSASSTVPDSLLALVRGLERSGDSAVSPAGAIGRYQIMPATAKGLGYDPSRLKDPAYNKKVATAYLAQLIKEYHGNLNEVLVGYNASTKSRRRFVASGDDTSVLAAETRKYLAHAAASPLFQKAQVEVLDLTGGAVAINLFQGRQ